MLYENINIEHAHLITQLGYTPIQVIQETEEVISYLVLHLIEQFEVEVKILKKKSYQKYFQRKMHLAQTLKHPNIVKTKKVGVKNGISYQVKECFRKYTLVESVAEKGKHPIPLVTYWLTKLCDVLGFAHDRHIIHRHLNPENIFFDNKMNVFLDEFGLARDNTSADIWKNESLQFYAPEFLFDNKFDHKANIYSIGSIIYFALTAKCPFEDVLLRDLIRVKHNKDDFVAKISPAVDRIIAKCMTFHPQKRYSDMKELKKEWLELWER